MDTHAERVKLLGESHTSLSTREANGCAGGDRLDDFVLSHLHSRSPACSLGASLALHSACIALASYTKPLARLHMQTAQVTTHAIIQSQRCADLAPPRFLCPVF